MLNALYEFMTGLTDLIFGAPEPDSNEALRRWLMEHPEEDIDNYPPFLTCTHSHSNPSNGKCSKSSPSKAIPA